MMIELDRRTLLTAEIQEHLDLHTVRAVAMENTSGLRRGAIARRGGGRSRDSVFLPAIGKIVAAGSLIENHAGRGYLPTSSRLREQPYGRPRIRGIAQPDANLIGYLWANDFRAHRRLAVALGGGWSNPPTSASDARAACSIGRLTGRTFRFSRKASCARF